MGSAEPSLASQTEAHVQHPKQLSSIPAVVWSTELLEVVLISRGEKL